MRGHLSRRIARTTIRMRPVQEPDLPILYEWSTAPDVARTWMYRGTTPSFPAFVDRMFANVLTQFVFVRETEQVGYGAIYDANMGSQRASIRMLLGPGERGRAAVADCFGLLAGHAFATFPFRKLYMETTDHSIGQFRGAVGLYFEEEARLHDYELFGDTWSDLIYLSVPRELFAARPSPLLRVALPPTAS